MSSYRTDCRFFTGYKPCRFERSCSGCNEFRPATPDILLINLDAIGDVLRTTALIPAIRREHPNARITWLTRARAAELLEGNPEIDRILVLDVSADILLRTLSFDIVLNADKSMVAGALTMQVNATERRGFGLDSGGAIIPLNSAAKHLFDLGLDNELKFKKNQRTDPDLLAEALGFVHQRDGYRLPLTLCNPGPSRRVGFNTGCGPTWPYKKLGLETTTEAIRRIVAKTDEPVLLLGGPEDDRDHAELASLLGDFVERTPLKRGLKYGASEINRCDVVVSGDSLGMHMAIALEKHVVAWFGVTCPQEIDLYDRGLKVLADVGCAPCWKATCSQVTPCRDKVEPEWISDAVLECLVARANSTPITGVRGGDWWLPT